jgi:hypothetical protein
MKRQIFPPCKQGLSDGRLRSAPCTRALAILAVQSCSPGCAAGHLLHNDDSVSSREKLYTVFFFEIKGRSTAISFRKKAILHHAPKRMTPHKQCTRTTHTTRHYTTTPWEKSQKKATAATPSSPTLCLAKAATRCKLHKWHSELLHHGLSPTSCTHTIVDPSAPTLLW